MVIKMACRLFANHEDMSFLAGIYSQYLNADLSTLLFFFVFYHKILVLDHLFASPYEHHLRLGEL